MAITLLHPFNELLYISHPFASKQETLILSGRTSFLPWSNVRSRSLPALAVVDYFQLFLLCQWQLGKKPCDHSRFDSKPCWGHFLLSPLGSSPNSVFSFALLFFHNQVWVWETRDIVREVLSITKIADNPTSYHCILKSIYDNKTVFPASVCTGGNFKISSLQYVPSIHKQ